MAPGAIDLLMSYEANRLECAKKPEHYYQYSTFFHRKITLKLIVHQVFSKKK